MVLWERESVSEMILETLLLYREEEDSLFIRSAAVLGHCGLDVEEEIQWCFCHTKSIILSSYTAFCRSWLTTSGQKNATGYYFIFHSYKLLQWLVSSLAEPLDEH